MSDPAFIQQYRAVYATLQYELSGHTGQCQNTECKSFGDGFRAAFNRLPKPPPSRKRK